MACQPRQIRQTRFVRWVAALACVLGCGDSAGETCVRTLCEPGVDGAVCVGHALRTCAADGRSFTYAACGSQQRCESGACVARVCTTLGLATCLSPTSAERCQEDGGGYETMSCGAAEVCKDGACVKSECAGEPDRCTAHGFVTCVNAAWVEHNCPVSQLCSLGSTGSARCLPAICAPEARSCDGETVRICDAQGGLLTSESCGRGALCRDGFCQAAVCGDSGPGDADVTDVTDGGETAETTEPPSEIVFTLNGVATTLDLSAVATFDAGGRQLTVKAQKSTRAFELRFAPANATLQGTFSSEVFNPVKVTVCYDGGGTSAAFADVAGFTHRAVAYEVSVTRNDGPGGRFVATFTAKLEDLNTDTIELRAGQINVKYR